jgi:hypothetical protein
MPLDLIQLVMRLVSPYDRKSRILLLSTKGTKQLCGTCRAFPYCSLSASGQSDAQVLHPKSSLLSSAAFYTVTVATPLFRLC